MSGLLLPAAAPLAHARHASKLARLFCGADWQARLDSARAELRKYGEVAPALALPLNKDPAGYRWPVVGRHVAIYGTLDMHVCGATRLRTTASDTVSRLIAGLAMTREGGS